MNAATLEFLSIDQFPRPADHALQPLWGDYLTRGFITLLTSRWKSGKTTLLSVLLQAMNEGGVLAGSAVAAGRAVVVSEEPPELWATRGRALNLGHVRFCCRPFRGRPGLNDWHTLVDHLVKEAPALAVIDPLAMVLPGHVENHASVLLATLEPLHRLAGTGAAVLLLHHPRKVGPTSSASPRGSGALTGFADILLELDRLPGVDDSDRRRTLRVAARNAPPRRLVIALNDAGTDYALVAPDASPDSFEIGWPMLHATLAARIERVPAQCLLNEWREDWPKPSLKTLRRWLERAEREGLVARAGCGVRGSPFRYALPNRTDLLPDLPDIHDLRQEEYELAQLVREADAVAAENASRRAQRRKKKIAGESTSDVVSD